MFEGVSSSPPVKKEKECGERSSIGQLHGRGLVSSLNKVSTHQILATTLRRACVTLLNVGRGDIVPGAVVVSVVMLGVL